VFLAWTQIHRSLQFMGWLQAATASGIPDSGWRRLATQQRRTQQAPEFDQPGTRLRYFTGRAACDQQAGKLAEVAAHAVDLQFAAALQQVAVHFATGQQGGEHRLTVEADGRVEQTVAAANTLAFMPEQLAVAADIQCGLEMAAGKTLVGGRAAEGDDIPVEQAG